MRLCSGGPSAVPSDPGLPCRALRCPGPRGRPWRVWVFLPFFVHRLRAGPRTPREPRVDRWWSAGQPGKGGVVGRRTGPGLGGGHGCPPLTGRCSEPLPGLQGEERAGEGSRAGAGGVAVTRTRMVGMRQDAGSSPAAPDAEPPLFRARGWCHSPLGPQSRHPPARRPVASDTGRFWVLSGSLTAEYFQDSEERTQNRFCWSPRLPLGQLGLRKLPDPPGGSVHGEGAAGRGKLSWGPPLDQETPARHTGPPLTCLGGGARGSHSDKTGTTCIHKPVGPEAAQGGHPGVRTLLCCP